MSARPGKAGTTAVGTGGLAAIAMLALVSSCANGNAASVQAQIAGQPSEPVIVTTPTVPSTPIAVTVPTTIATTTTASTTTLAPTTIATTTTSTIPALKAPLFPVTPVRRGSSGDAVKVLQARLLDVGFWVDKVDGHYGTATSQAVMAFQKYYGVSDRSGRVDQATAAAMNAVRVRPKPQTTVGDLIEVNKKLQVLFVVRKGRAVWTFNTSTGSGHPYTAISHKDLITKLSGDAQTPDGLYKVNRERPVGWWEGELGRLYRPKYFRGGIAVHGSNSIPNHPASHGCVRVSTVAMDFIWAANLMPLGSAVWVHS